jgi:hypothetical protein
VASSFESVYVLYRFYSLNALSGFFLWSCLVMNVLVELLYVLCVYVCVCVSLNNKVSKLSYSLNIEHPFKVVLCLPKNHRTRGSRRSLSVEYAQCQPRIRSRPIRGLT